MQANITTRLVDRLTPQAHPFEVQDESFPGLWLRVNPTGGMTFYLRYRMHGRSKRVKLARYGELSIPKVRDKAKLMTAKVAQGIDPAFEVKEARRAAQAEADAMTLGDLVDIYEPWVTANRKRGSDTVKRLKYAFKPLLNRKVATLDIVAFDRHRSERLSKPLKGRKKPPTAAAIERDLTVLRAMLNWAVKRRYLKENPMAGLERLKYDRNKPVRFLSDEEETRLYEALKARDGEKRERHESFNQWRAERGHKTFPPLPEPYCDYVEPAIRLALATGMRRAELLGLEWVDVNLGEGMVTVHGERAKSGKTRHIPLAPSTVAMLTAWRAQHEADARYVFPGPDGGPMHDMRSSFDAVLKRAKIAGFRFHDLRHSYASKLVRRGVDLYQVSKLLGHASIVMTERYAHLAPDTLRAAVAVLEDPKPVGEIVPFEKHA